MAAQVSRDLEPWYLENLVCPVDKTPLTPVVDALVSDAGRSYPVVEGVPVMLTDDGEHTIDLAASSIARAQDAGSADQRAVHLYLESLGIREAEKERLVELARRNTSGIDPVVAFLIGATNGLAYTHLIGRLGDYPIPDLRLPAGGGRTFLDLGCNWGRWCIAAARKGYMAIGIDPSLGAVMAARRVARQLAFPIRYVVADARYLPFRDARFNVVFSYSVLQHMSKINVLKVLAEIARVLRLGARSLIQMPNWLGMRCLYHQAKRRFREPRDFEVRYWSVSELKRIFEAQVGPSSISVDCYFGLGLQTSDKHLMPNCSRFAIEVSERLRGMSESVAAMKYLADSLYVESLKAEQ